ncbi:helix-turn-helix domain-containing protein [Aliiroseovarius crassostreae]|uniref:Helix-turn-helix domain-containing protein n=1 Tax=Aliiroseovarius crassostreae TaxID=154981 RepID=A0A9Q9H9E2_9RHOB|nr:helix-turn-helix domain-containing protein [Aliiroseovarius crassostreae]UWP88845.1 helix-turn-helix domain-containing protein [Aliiroseovarius crassostreae]UWP92002.1 helix-turn-helix domain-containing protein [Aliiroseovarius crassostreae]UWP95151.1 helix-turn-helix domain-containing protein [Aliiroseovarius crassostreae]UWQ01495.1 helix-turn-helix domain-containing protein [Aliiroseovarius crassostreae]
MDVKTPEEKTTPDPRTVREGANLSAEEMADLIGMSVNGYQLWENGHRQPGGPAFKLLGLMAQDSETTIRLLRSLQS